MIILQIIITVLFLSLLYLIFQSYKTIKKLCCFLWKKNIVFTCLTYVNQEYNELNEDEKYVVVREAVLDLLKENNLEVNDNELDILIESALYKINNLK